MRLSVFRAESMMTHGIFEASSFSTTGTRASLSTGARTTPSTFCTMKSSTIWILPFAVGFPLRRVPVNLVAELLAGGIGAGVDRLPEIVRAALGNNSDAVGAALAGRGLVVMLIATGLRQREGRGHGDKKKEVFHRFKSGAWVNEHLLAI